MLSQETNPVRLSASDDPYLEAETFPMLLKEDQIEILNRMLSLESPALTGKMLRYLNRDEHCAAFLSLVTRLEPSLDDDVHSFIRDGPSHSHIKGEKVEREESNVTDELMRSYRATMLLTNDDSSDAVISLFESQARLMIKCIFPIFQSNAHGNLRHACKLIDRILRYYLDDAYCVIGANGRTCGRYMQSMLEHIEHPHVADLFLTLICKPHNAALLRVYICPPQTKMTFYKALADTQIILLLSQHVCDPSYSESHAIAAADVLLELLDRLAADDYGSVVLESVGHSSQLLESLVKTALMPESKHTHALLSPPSGRRTAAIKCLSGLLHKCSLEEVAGPPTSPYQSFGSTIVNMVQNQLYPAKAFVFGRVQSHLPEILAYLQKQFILQQASHHTSSTFVVKHTAYTVSHPFTEFRMYLVQILVELVEQSPKTNLLSFSVDLWRVLTSWFVQYPHTNLYHHGFFRLVFLALRTNDEKILKPMLKQVKLVTTLIDLYRKEPQISSRGYIIQICNSIRLQAATLPPDSFLRSFLQSHATWRSFETELRDVTCASVVKGLGIPVPAMMRMSMMGQPPPINHIAIDSTEPGTEIDLGSEFAWKLGFVDDEEFEIPLEQGSGKKKKKKKNKNKTKTTTLEQVDDGGNDTSDEISPLKSSTNEMNEIPTEEEEEDVKNSIESTKDKTKKKRKKQKK